MNEKHKNLIPLVKNPVIWQGFEEYLNQLEQEELCIIRSTIEEANNTPKLWAVRARLNLISKLRSLKNIATKDVEVK